LFSTRKRTPISTKFSTEGLLRGAPAPKAHARTVIAANKRNRYTCKERKDGAPG